MSYQIEPFFLSVPLPIGGNESAFAGALQVREMAGFSNANRKIVLIDCEHWPSFAIGDLFKLVCHLAPNIAILVYNTTAINLELTDIKAWDDHYLVPILGDVGILLPTKSEFYKYASALYSGETLRKDEITPNEFETLVQQIKGISRKENDTQIIHHQDVMWLGLAAKNMSDLLTSAFNGDIHSIDETMIDQVTSSSKEAERIKAMMSQSPWFKVIQERNSRHFQISFTKKELYPLITAHFNDELLSELLRCNAMNIIRKDTGEADVAIHRFDRIFEGESLFAQKLLSRMNKMLQTSASEEPTKILIHDTGRQREFRKSLEHKTGYEIIRAINYEDNMRLFPYDEIKTTDKVAIVTDVVDQGTHLQNLAQLVMRSGAKVVTVVTIAVGTAFREKYLSNDGRTWLYEYLSNDGKPPLQIKLPFRWLFEKGMQSHPPVRNRPLDKHGRNYILFWNMIESSGGVRREHRIARGNEERYGEKHFEHIVELPVFDNQNELLNDFFAFLEFGWNKPKFTAVIVNKESLTRSLANAICRKYAIRKTPIIIDFKKPEEDQYKLDKNDILLILDDGANTYSAINNVVRQLYNTFADKLYVCILFARSPIEPVYKQEVENRKMEIERLTGNRLKVYWQSGLPFYMGIKERGRRAGICPSCFDEWYRSHANKWITSDRELISALNIIESMTAKRHLLGQ